MAINFPNPATLNQTYTVGSKTWVYNGYAWDLVSANTSPILNVATSAFNQANAAYTKANTETIGQAAFIQANSAFAAANTGVTIGQAAFAAANTETIGKAAFTQANTGVTIGQAGFGQANAAFTAANTGITIAQAAYAQANTGGGGGGGLTATAIQTSNYVASINQLVRCNTAAGAFSVTFPASPTDGGTIGIIDIAGTFGANNLTLLPNTKFIESDATSFVLDLNNTYASFVYNTSTSNWKLLETPQANNGPTPTPIKTSAYSAVINDIVRCNTTAGAFSVTLPTNPSDGSIISIVDVSGAFYTNNITLIPAAGSTIESDTAVILDVNSAYASFMYNAATTNWRLLQTPIGVLTGGSSGFDPNFLLMGA